MLSVEEIRALDKAEKWDVLRTMGLSLCDGHSGDDLARVYIALSRAWERTAKTPQDWRVAIGLAYEGKKHANPEGYFYLWIVHQIAVLCTDAGRYAEAETMVKEFFRLAPRVARSPEIAPWMYWVRGRIHVAHGENRKAIADYEVALNGNMPDAYKDVIRTNIAWAYAREGQVGRALMALPSTIPNNVALLAGVHAVIAAKSNDWESASQFARTALMLHRNSGQPVCHAVEITQMYAVLHHVMLATRRPVLAIAWSVRALTDPVTLHLPKHIHLLPRFEAEGGECIDAETSRTGSAGTKRCGTLGTVG